MLISWWFRCHTTRMLRPLGRQLCAPAFRQGCPVFRIKLFQYSADKNRKPSPCKAFFRQWHDAAKPHGDPPRGPAVPPAPTFRNRKAKPPTLFPGSEVSVKQSAGRKEGNGRKPGFLLFQICALGRSPRENLGFLLFLPLDM